ncbi:unnamed protein product [Symbiodinium sp. CCMP2456]|nr:unnamed protein product [Symbiodinium sp. CCMP2456]
MNLQVVPRSLRMAHGSAAALRGVERSAALCALWRAMESAAASPLIQDPLAAALAEAALGDEAAKLRGATFAPSLQYLVSLRGWIIDEALDAWLHRHSACQVVQLAVGCDTRASRLGHRGAMWFEVDTPRVAAFRRRFFSANDRAVQLGVDLTGPISLHDALVEGGFRRDLPAAWICEGLFEYHDEAFADRLLAEIGGLSGMGDQMLLLAVLDLYWLQYLKEQHAQKPVRLAWKSSRLPGLQKVSARIAAHGWKLQEVTSEMRLAEQMPREGAQVESLFHVLRACDSKIAGVS